MTPEELLAILAQPQARAGLVALIRDGLLAADAALAAGEAAAQREDPARDLDAPALEDGESA